MVSSESKTYGTFSVGQGHTLAAEYTPNTGRSATCLVRDRNLVLSLRQAQDVSVMVYDLDGKIHSKGCFKRHIPAGTHTLPLTIGQTPKGMYIVGVSCAEFAKNISVMNAKNEQK
jgi:hypothetical protein